jgi:hypothetical protein
MNIKQIKQAVDSGKKVYWSNKAYQVIHDSIGQWLIHCSINNNCVGLHGMKGTKYENVLNGEESDFFV